MKNITGLSMSEIERKVTPGLRTFVFSRDLLRQILDEFLHAKSNGLYKLPAHARMIVRNGQAELAVSDTVVTYDIP